MSKKKLKNVHASLCLQKIRGFLADPQSIQKKEMAELALEHLDSIYGGVRNSNCRSHPFLD